MDFPQPFGPTMLVTTPCGNAAESPSMNGSFPYENETPRSSMADAAARSFDSLRSLRMTAEGFAPSSAEPNGWAVGA